ncbi:MAG: LytTR family DNA-binding domain-containing protein [Oscillospiraceae bacterium]|nr:LytTR family DNA-binding domain-containing protein [Oscillospiraceae bacterium]MDY2848329.1 LytTR family DNA-binding domain-containing protein [Oscillospiraceae bacterium]
MKITIEEIGRDSEEEIILRCHEVNDSMLDMVRQLRALQTGLAGYRDGEIHKLSFDDIYYFEVVDSKSFFYCREEVFESRLKLYEFEELCRGTGFFRASKSMIVNSDKIDYVSPSFSGRFEAALENGEKVMVSRQYVGVLKEIMGL